MANSVDPDQTSDHLGLHYLTQICQSENLRRSCNTDCNKKGQWFGFKDLKIEFCKIKVEPIFLQIWDSQYYNCPNQG